MLDACPIFNMFAMLKIKKRLGTQILFLSTSRNMFGHDHDDDRDDDGVLTPPPPPPLASLIFSYLRTTT